jgi:small conductance mechanosensitive channel
VADPQILGVEAIKGSELIFPVIFKTLATQQYAPLREFRRRVRLALEENHMLPGDPYRVFNSFTDKAEGSRNRPSAETAKPERDPTTLKPQESNPFGGE